MRLVRLAGLDVIGDCDGMSSSSTSSSSTSLSSFVVVVVVDSSLQFHSSRVWAVDDENRLEWERDWDGKGGVVVAIDPPIIRDGRHPAGYVPMRQRRGRHASGRSGTRIRECVRHGVDIVHRRHATLEVILDRNRGGALDDVADDDDDGIDDARGSSSIEASLEW